MTNWQTISNSIRRLRELDEQFEMENLGLTKKELLGLNRERDKLERALGGIKEMGGLPDILFVIDTNKEAIAVAEARKLRIPLVGIIDSNSDPEAIDYPVPGNDDAIRAVSLYCDLMAGAVLDGIQTELAASGADVGETEDVPLEELPLDAEGDAPAMAAEEIGGTVEEPEAAVAPQEAPADDTDTEARDPKVEGETSGAEEAPGETRVES